MTEDAPTPRLRRAARALGRHLRARAEWYWAPLLYAAAFVFLYRPIFFGDGRQLGFGWDTIESYWPDLSYLAASLRDLEWPLWNPFEKGGSAYYASPERGTYYPLNWLFAGYGAAVGEASWWLGQVKQWSHHLIAALSMHAFLRSRSLPAPAAVVGGVAWLGSAPLLIHKASSVIWPMAWVPLLWLATDRLVTGPTWRRGAALGAAVALAGLSGSPPGFFYALLLALPYGLWRTAGALWAARGDRQELVTSVRRLAAAIGVAATVALGLLWVMLGPAAELTALSQRAERSLAYALSFPLPSKATLIGLIAPLSGKWDSTLGVAAILLATCALALRPRADGGVPILLLVLAALFTALSFGGGTPLLPWLVEHVPGFDLFRASNRYKLLAAPALAALAGYGTAALLAAPRRWSRPRITALITLLVGGGILAGAALLLPVVHAHPKLPGPGFTAAIAAATASLSIAALLLPRRFGAAAASLLAVLILMGPQRYVHAKGYALEARVDERDARWLEGLADVRTQWRVYDEFVLEQRAGSRLGLREFRGYPAGGSLEYQRYADIVAMAKRRPEILEAFNIRYVLHGGHHRAGKRPNHIRRPPHQVAPQHFRRLRPHVHEALHPAPAVAWYGAARFVEGPGSRALDQVLAAEGEDGIRRVVVLEPDARAALGQDRADALTAAAAAPPEPVSGHIERYERSRVVLRVDAPGPGIVVLSDTHYPGWKVHVDGEPATSFFANTFVRGVAVGAGPHTIEWRFVPDRHGLRLLAFWTALLAAILAAVPPRRWRQKT